MDRVNAERYQRQTVLPDFGEAGQERLLTAKVCIVGAGGLGVPVLQYLTAMGVGTIGMVDDDVVSLSNLHRQVLYAPEDIGQSKVAVAKDKLEKQNPKVSFKVFNEMLSAENASVILSGFDVVVDCTDAIDVRYVINDACVSLGIPFVYGALYRHEGQVSVFNFKGSPTYHDAFPDDTASVENCNEIGVLGVLPGIIGMYQALETVKILTGFGESLVGKLLVIDAANMEHHVFQLSKKSNPPTKPKVMKHDALTWQAVRQLDPSEYHFLDVREPIVFQSRHDPLFENVPMKNLTAFVPSKPCVVLVCQMGVTTVQAASLLHARHPSLQIFQVKGGYNAL